ncbi:MAG: sugar ABC transporter permease, partial [Cyanobacteria bacterium J06643_5]
MKQLTRQQQNLTGYLFLAPTILVLGIFVILPILYAVFLSLQKVQLLGGIEYEFVGFRNFSQLVEDIRLNSVAVWLIASTTSQP